MFNRWTPHPVIVAIRDNEDCIRVIFLVYHYYRVGGPPKVLFPKRESELSAAGTLEKDPAPFFKLRK